MCLILSMCYVGIKIADFGVSAQITATLAKRKSFIGSPYWYVFFCIACFNLSFKTLALLFGEL